MFPDLNPRWQDLILSATGALAIRGADLVQELWSGYGQLLRLRLTGTSPPSVIAKVIRMESVEAHPRGWNSATSHQRKLTSYRVESHWYREWSHQCGPDIRIPKLLAFDQHDGEILLVLEDLDEAGYPVRLQSVNSLQLTSCLDWLARFHARFLGYQPDGLWETGTYWHLATRGDELEALKDPALKKAAPVIDNLLKEAHHQTLVHGDAKLANFCFSEGGEAVAAVDFQYVGGGCGMKDLAYFIGSCLDESACGRREKELLDHYFIVFRTALTSRHPEIDPDEVEAEWRALFPLAWTDFHRFLKGWSPGHWKIHSYSERLARSVLNDLSL